MLALVYKDFAPQTGVSHTGLAVTAIQTAKVLAHEGIAAEPWPVAGYEQVMGRFAAAKPSHVVILAPWIPAEKLAAMAAANLGVSFAVCSHSNLGFLHGDPGGMRSFRQAVAMQRDLTNFHAAGNCKRFCRWIHAAYREPCAWLPNLYQLGPTIPPAQPVGGMLRIGAFGSTRILKNLVTAAGAALEIANDLDKRLELWISVDRSEPECALVLPAVREVLDDLPHVEIVETGWLPWPKFRATVGRMHLLMQPSYTESFNTVTADGVAKGVPSVVSHAIEWAPEYWKAKVDDAADMARVGLCLLADPQAAAKGFQALQSHNREGVEAWRFYLEHRSREI